MLLCTLLLEENSNKFLKTKKSPKRSKKAPNNLQLMKEKRIKNKTKKMIRKMEMKRETKTVLMMTKDLQQVRLDS
jgi:hypothetical protein